MSEVEAGELNGAAAHSIPAEMLPSQESLEEEAKEREAEEERRRNREPAVVFTDIDVSTSSDVINNIQIGCAHEVKFVSKYFSVRLL